MLFLSANLIFEASIRFSNWMADPAGANLSAVRLPGTVQQRCAGGWLSGTGCAGAHCAGVFHDSEGNRTARRTRERTFVVKSRCAPHPADSRLVWGRYVCRYGRVIRNSPTLDQKLSAGLSISEW